MEAVQYLWVVRRGAGEMMVCDWADEPRALATRDFNVTPDLDLGRPVFRLLPNGYVGQYFRFERIAEPVE